MIAPSSLTTLAAVYRTSEWRLSVSGVQAGSWKAHFLYHSAAASQEMAREGLVPRPPGS
jgi:hypothetical protein